MTEEQFWRIAIVAFGLGLIVNRDVIWSAIQERWRHYRASRRKKRPDALG